MTLIQIELRKPLALAIARADVAKLAKVRGSVHVTYAAKASCGSCPMTEACYGRAGRTGFVVRRLSDRPASPEAVAQAEALAIRRTLPDDGKPIRLHIHGDCSTDDAARILSRGATIHRRSVWTYTHSWRAVRRDSWDGVSVLASVESITDVAEARKRGYVAAVVLPEFPSDTAFVVGGEKIVPCPQQTGRAGDCMQCRLCWDDAALRKARVSIGFRLHGGVDRKAVLRREAERLRAINGSIPDYP